MKRAILLFTIASLCSCGARPSVKDDQLLCLRQMQFLWEQLDTYIYLCDGYPPASLTDDRDRVLYSWRFDLIAGAGSLQCMPPDGPWPDGPGYEPFETGDCSGFSTIYAARDKENRLSSPRAKLTDFLALTGQGTAFTELENSMLSSEELSKTLKEAADAILLVECASDLHWIEPGDVTKEEILNSKSAFGLGDLNGNYVGCFAVLFVDGAAWFLKDSVPKSEIAKFLTIKSAKEYDREIILKDYLIQMLPPLPPIEE